MIIAQNLVKSFRTQFYAPKFKAIDDVSFSLRENSNTGFLGANGAGKTTLIKILFNFVFADSGSISFSKALGKNSKEVLKNVGFLPERPYFYPDLTGLEFIHYLASLSGLSRIDINKKIPILSEQLKIDFALNRKVRSFSKGMLQRLGFLTAIIHDPQMVILDEPMAGLDPLGRTEFKEIILDLKKRGKTVFFSSHIVSDIEEICDNLIVLQKGKLLYEGALQSLMDKHFYTHYKLKTKNEISWLDKNSNDNHYRIERSQKQDVLEKLAKEK